MELPHQQAYLLHWESPEKCSLSCPEQTQTISLPQSWRYALPAWCPSLDLLLDSNLEHRCWTAQPKVKVLNKISTGQMCDSLTLTVRCPDQKPKEGKGGRLHSLQYQHFSCCHTDDRDNTFLPCTVLDWNKLPPEAVLSQIPPLASSSHLEGVIAPIGKRPPPPHSLPPPQIFSFPQPPAPAPPPPQPMTVTVRILTSGH